MYLKWILTVNFFFSPIFVKNETPDEKDCAACVCREPSLGRCKGLLTELTIISGHRAAVASKNVGLAAQGFYCFR